MKDGIPTGLAPTGGTGALVPLDGTTAPPKKDPVADDHPTIASDKSRTQGQETSPYGVVGAFDMARIDLGAGPLPPVTKPQLRTAAQNFDHAIDLAAGKANRTGSQQLQDLAALQKAYRAWQHATKGKSDDPEVLALTLRFRSRLGALVSRASAQLAREATADLPAKTPALKRLQQYAKDVTALSTQAAALGVAVDPTDARNGAAALIDRAFGNLQQQAVTLAAAGKLSGADVQTFVSHVQAFRAVAGTLGLNLTPAAGKALQDATTAAMTHRADRLVAWGQSLQTGGVTADELRQFHGSAVTYKQQVTAVGAEVPDVRLAAVADTEKHLVAGRIQTVDKALRAWAAGDTGSMDDLRAIAGQIREVRALVGQDPELKQRLATLEGNLRTVILAGLEATGLTATTLPTLTAQQVQVASALLQIAAETGVTLPKAIAELDLPKRIDQASQSLVKDTIDAAQAQFSALHATLELGLKDPAAAKKQLGPIIGNLITAYTNDNDPMHAIVVEALKDPQALALYNAGVMVQAGDGFGAVAMMMADRKDGGLGIEGFNRIAKVLTSEENLTALQKGEGVTFGSIHAGIRNAVGKFETASYGYALMVQNREDAVFFVRWTMSAIGTSTSTLRDKRDAAKAEAQQRETKLMDLLANGKLDEFDDLVRTTAALGLSADKDYHKTWSADIDTAEAAVKWLQRVKTTSDVVGLCLGAGAIARLGATVAVRGGLMLAARSPAVINLARTAAVEGAEELAVVGSRRVVADLALKGAGQAAKTWASANLPTFTRLAGTSLVRGGVGAANWLTGGAVETAVSKTLLHTARAVVGDVVLGAIQFVQVNPQTGQVSFSARDDKGDIRWGAIAMAGLPLALRGGAAVIAKMKPVPPLETVAPKGGATAGEVGGTGDAGAGGKGQGAVNDVPAGKPSVVADAVPNGKPVEIPPEVPNGKSSVVTDAVPNGKPVEISPEGPNGKSGAVADGMPNGKPKDVGAGAAVDGAQSPPARPNRKMMVDDFVDDFGRPPQVGDPVPVKGEPYRVKSVDGDMINLEPVGAESPKPFEGSVVEPATKAAPVAEVMEGTDLTSFHQRAAREGWKPVANEPGTYVRPNGTRIKVSFKPPALEPAQLEAIHAEKARIKDLLASGTLTDVEAARQKAILQGLETMEQSGYAVNNVTHGTNSRALDGIEKAGGKIMSERMMNDTRITRVTGEGDAFSGKSGAKNDIYLGTGDEGLGTVRAYFEQAKASKHYNLSLMSDAELAGEIKKMEDLVGRKWEGRSYFNLVDEARAQSRLRTLKAEQSLRTNLPPNASARSPYPIMFDFAPEGLAVKPIVNLPGEATLEGMIDLHGSLKRVFVPADRVAETTARMEKILGPGNGVQVLPMEALDVVMQGNAKVQSATGAVGKILKDNQELVDVFYESAHRDLKK